MTGGLRKRKAGTFARQFGASMDLLGRTLKYACLQAEHRREVEARKAQEQADQDRQAAA